MLHGSEDANKASSHGWRFSPKIIVTQTFYPFRGHSQSLYPLVNMTQQIRRFFLEEESFLQRLGRLCAIDFRRYFLQNRSGV